MDNWFSEWSYISWFALALILGILEIFSNTTYFLWMAIGAVITGIVSIVFGFDVYWQFAIFAVASLCCIALGSKYLAPKQQIRNNSNLNKRSSEFIGQVYRLESAIENGRGEIKIGDSFWKIKGPDCPVNTKIKVIDAQGLYLIVEQVEDH